MLRRIYEVDSSVCPRCAGELKIVSVITDPVVIDEILSHRRERRIEGRRGQPEGSSGTFFHHFVTVSSSRGKVGE